MSKPIYLVVTPFFPSPDNWRGPFVLDQVKAIQRNSDYEVVVMKPRMYSDDGADYEYDGVKVHYFKFVGMPSSILNGLPNTLNGILFLQSLRSLGIKYKDVKVVHSHTAILACCASALKRKNREVKSIVQYHDPDPYGVRNGRFTDKTWNNTWKAKFLISQFKNIDLHICISKKVEYNLIHFPNVAENEWYDSYKIVLSHAKNVAVPQLNTYILHNGVDTSIFHKLNGFGSNQRFKIGCIANFADWKDQMTLIKAVEVLKGKIINLEVSLIGSGPEYNTCVEYCREHKLNDIVKFERELHHQNLTIFYNTLDLFVLPSYFEGFGCVFTEAYACGIPFITCKGQGMDDFIPVADRDKWLIEPQDVTGLADKIYKYYTQRYVQKLSKPYDIDIVISKYLSYLGTL